MTMHGCKNLILRPAAIQDADLLLAWRNDEQTREASHSRHEVMKEEHLSWLTDTLNNSNKKLFIAEECGVPVGTVRSDYSNGVYELSWTVAPDARGRGIGKRMVAVLAEQIAEPIRAEIKAGNKASLRIAEYVEMDYEREGEGIVHYYRGAALKPIKS